MRELQKYKIREVIQRGDYRTLSQLCLELLKVDNWLDGWRKLETLIQTSGEYVLAKFMASAYVLSNEDIYKTLDSTTKQFLARDVVVCLEKMVQVIDALSRRKVESDTHAARGV